MITFIRISILFLLLHLQLNLLLLLKHLDLHLLSHLPLLPLNQYIWLRTPIPLLAHRLLRNLQKRLIHNLRHIVLILQIILLRVIHLKHAPTGLRVNRLLHLNLVLQHSVHLPLIHRCLQIPPFDPHQHLLQTLQTLIKLNDVFNGELKTLVLSLEPIINSLHVIVSVLVAELLSVAVADDEEEVVGGEGGEEGEEELEGVRGLEGVLEALEDEEEGVQGGSEGEVGGGCEFGDGGLELGLAFYGEDVARHIVDL